MYIFASSIPTAGEWTSCQGCHGLQSSWLCKLHSCLASCLKTKFQWMTWHHGGTCIGFMKKSLLLPLICSCGLRSLQSTVEHLPIHSKVISSRLSCIFLLSIVSGCPVTGSKSFPAIVALCWVVLSKYEGSITCRTVTGIDYTLRGGTLWYVLDWSDMWISQSSILANSGKGIENWWT